MPTPFTFSGTSFATLNVTEGVENLSPGVNRPAPCTLSAVFNSRFNSLGGVYNRDGYTAATTLGSSRVDDAALLPIYNVTFWKSGTSVYQATKTGLDAGTAYTIGLTRTATEKDFFFPHERNMYLTNETDSFTRIAVSKVSAINSGAGTFSLTSGDGEYFSSGTVYIRGTAITGGTLSTDSYSGCSGLTGSMAIGDIVTQTSTPSGAPKGYCMDAFQSSALVGKRDTVFASLPSNDEEPELFYNFSLTDGATAKRMHGLVRCIKTGLKVSLIGMLNGIDVATDFEPDTGALFTLPLTRVHGVPNNRSIVEIDNKFAILTNEGRILIAVNGLNGFEIIDNPDTKKNFDYPVSRYIKENKDQEDNSQNFLHYNPASKTLKAVILMKSGLTEEIICQTDINAWSIDDSKNFRCRVNVQGAEYAGDDSTGVIHHDEYGFTDNGTPIISRITTGKFKLGRRGTTGDYLNLTYGGTLSENAVFKQRIIHNNTIDEEQIMAEDLIEDGQMTTEGGVSLGGGELGAEIMGGEGLTTDVFEFTYPYEMAVEAESIQLEWEISDEGGKMELRWFELSGETENELLINPA